MTTDPRPRDVCFGHPPTFEIPAALSSPNRVGEPHIGVRFGDRAPRLHGRAAFVDGEYDRFAYETWLGPDGWSASYDTSHSLRYRCDICRRPVALVRYGNVTLAPVPLTAAEGS